MPANNIMMFPAGLAPLSPLAKRLTQQMASLPAADEWHFTFDLAVCKTTANITRYTLHGDRESCFGVEFGVADRRVTLRLTDTGETLPAERLALACGDEHFDVDPLVESSRGLRLILRAVDFFDVKMNAGENVVTLIKALPDSPVNYSTDKDGG